MIKEIDKAAEMAMKKAITALTQNFSKIRTGRAHPSLLENIMVSYYGNNTPLNQVANIAVENARTLTVTPWEKQLVNDIEKAILTSELGLNPNSAGAVIRVPLPALTEERRKDLIKIIRKEAEAAKITIRNTRRDALAGYKVLVKDKSISEDDEFRAQAEIQKLTDRYIEDIDQLTAKKEKDLMEI